MTFVSHGVAGGLIHFLVWGNPIWVGVGVVLGVAPDVLGLWWHDEVHSGKVNRWLRWIPAWGYHTFLDSLCRPYSKYKARKIAIESLHWVVYGIIGYFYFRG